MDFTEFKTKHNAKMGGFTGNQDYKAFADSLQLEVPVLVPTTLIKEGTKAKNAVGTIIRWAHKAGKSIQQVADGNDIWLCYVGPYTKRTIVKKKQ